MKKILLVLGFLAVASFAANAAVPAPYTVQFNGYCDGIYIAHLDAHAFAGVHLLGDCANNFYGGGFKSAAPGWTYYTGAADQFSDPLYGIYGINASLEFLMQVSGKKKCAWVIWEGPDGVSLYFINAGLCTKIADSKALVKGTKSSTGR